MKTSQSIGEISKALVKAQGEMTHVPRTRDGRVGNKEYKYADLANVLDAVRDVLKANGLAVVQGPAIVVTESRRTSVLTTRLIHESGEWLETELDLLDPGTSQAMGSAITYARRYALAAMLGVAAEDDLDGESGGSGAKSGSTEDTGLRPDVEQLKHELFKVGQTKDARQVFVLTSLNELREARGDTPFFGHEEVGTLESLSDADITALLTKIANVVRGG